MQKTNNSSAQNAHRQMQSSTTLSRRYVRRPQRGNDIMVSVIKKVNANSAQVKNLQATIAKNGLQNKTQTASVLQNNVAQANQPTAKELKDKAIKKALEAAAAPKETTKKQKKSKKSNIHFGFSRTLLAISCATAAVMAIVYFANLNMPDMSLQVAALQTGINASYPSYVPRDFSTSSITSEDGKVTLEFKNYTTGDAFAITEETSSWDSNALESNFVKDEYGDNYTVVREQGLTIYISGSDAAWVNGGVVFKLDTKSGSLTNKQIKSIAVSM
jgi:hypothetical protein